MRQAPPAPAPRIEPAVALAPEAAPEPAPAPADPVGMVKANADAAHAGLDAEAAKSEAPPSSQASVKPQPARRGPLTPAEESEIDEQVMP